MDSLFDALKNMGASRLAAMLLTFFGLVIFFIYIALRSNAPGMTMLYSGLSSSDATEISAKLSVANIDYRLLEDGARIDVPQQTVGKARMLLAQEGLPRRGSVGYEIFDKKQAFGTTSFVQNINKVRALEGELARTIGTIDNVKNARVHLVLPEQKLFSREIDPASASVFLNLTEPGAMGKEQLQAIQHIVAAAVPNLKSSKVTVVDQSGNLLAKGDDDSTIGNNASNSSDMKSSYEKRMERSIEEIIGKVVGFGKIRATVSAEMNFDVISRNSESYDPEGQVVRSTQTTSDENIDNSGSTKNAVSIENNLPGLGDAAAAGASEQVPGIKSNRTEEITNFEITKTVESVAKSIGEVEKLSIAVLVDGIYDVDTTVTKPVDAPVDWVAPRKYKPRAQEELDKIEKLVKTAVGFDKNRGDTLEVVNMQFAEDIISGDLIKDDTKIMGFNKADLLHIAETLTLSVVAVLVILLVLKPLAAHIAASSKGRSGVSMADEHSMISGGYSQQAQLAAPDSQSQQAPEQTELEAMIDMSQVEGRVKASSVQKITELVDNHPTETVSVIRTWLSQES